MLSSHHLASPSQLPDSHHGGAITWRTTLQPAPASHIDHQNSHLAQTRFCSHAPILIPFWIEYLHRNMGRCTYRMYSDGETRSISLRRLERDNPPLYRQPTLYNQIEDPQTTGIVKLPKFDAKHPLLTQMQSLQGRPRRTSLFSHDRMFVFSLE